MLAVGSPRRRTVPPQRAAGGAGLAPPGEAHHDGTVSEPTDPTDAPSPAGPAPGTWTPGRGPWGPPGRRGRRGLYDRRLAGRTERWSVAGRALAAVLARPELVLRVAGRAAPVERGGLVLNRGVQALLVLASALERLSSPGGAEPDPVVTRGQFTAVARVAMPVRTDVHVTGRRVPGPEGAPDLPVRVYRRFGTGVGRGPRPAAITYFHGGGWVVGGLDSHDASCRLLAAVTGCVVVAVDYRLAPEHPYPAAVEDCLAAYTWVHDHHRELGTAEGVVGVMGDSAGGNLAAVVALCGRDGAVPAPVAQGLVYPALDARLDSPSIHEFADGFFLTRTGMEAYRAHYLPDPATWEAWQASPVLAEDKRGVAPALVVTAGFDPLRDEGAAFARDLEAVDVDVEYRCYGDMVHGFFGMGVVPDCLALATEVCDAMGALMRRAGRDAGV
jgi:acetyl esterase